MSNLKSAEKGLDEKILLDNLGKIAFTLDKAYLSALASDYTVCPFDEVHKESASVDSSVDYEDNIRAIKIRRWMYEKNEKPEECFKNVLSAFAEGTHTLALVVKRTQAGTEMYFVIQSQGKGKNEKSKDNVALLDGTIRGNFQGTETSLITDPQELEEIFSFDDTIEVDGKETPLYSSVAVLTNAPSEFADDHTIQGLDKLLNGIIPGADDESYSVVFLMESLSQNQVQEILAGYEELASAIAPFMQYQFQMGYTETGTKGETQSLSHSESISNSVFKTHSINFGINGGIGLNAALGPINRGANAGAGLSYGYSWGTSKTITTGKTTTEGKSSSLSIGLSESSSYTYKSYLVSNLLDRLEKTMKRISEGSAIGIWKYSVYVLANKSSVSRNVANYLRAITQGKDSFVEPAFIQEWIRSNGNEENASAFDEIVKYVSHFCHPVFVTAAKDMLVTATSFVATDQLSNVVAFPRKSMLGLPLLEGVEFGREVVTYSGEYEGEPEGEPEGEHDKEGKPEDKRDKKEIELGNIVHMHHDERQLVKLDCNSLTAHAFITGSTGVGKSNAIYQILDKLSQKNINVSFLVIEPAKGEYKSVWGRRNGVAVNVWGTNPNKAPLLRVNPFSFPEDIHVLEHIDRLVEIINACWPMYAAMPAILKDAIEQSYQKCGWNLTRSTCVPRRFPTFNDLLEALPVVINSSAYSADTSSDYKGALITRVHSLTNGIYGQIFCSQSECSSEELFDQNAIVDLSRVGSNETKSLLMGILVMKLQEHRQEHRMAEGGMNSDLKHVTVLEEAHSLLRRTATEQSQDSSNLQGKAVEMLSNAIAEMRTYGEGFIIADQAPGLLDMAVIRNTNTKIILRLPDQSDRELVGRAAGLNDDQITELAKLPRGVAAVYQNDWLQPVLCHFAPFNPTDSAQQNSSTAGSTDKKILPEAQKCLFGNIFCGDNRKLAKEQADALHEWVRTLAVGDTSLSILRKAIDACSASGESTLLNGEKLSIAYNAFDGKQLASIVEQAEESKGDGTLEQLYALVGLDLDHRIAHEICDCVMQVCDKIKPECNLAEKFKQISDKEKGGTCDGQIF